MNEYLLTFELHSDATAKQLAIHGSPEGLEALANSLLRLARNTKEGHFNHNHLMSTDWGGEELTSTPQSEESEILDHVKIYCWKGSQFQT